MKERQAVALIGNGVAPREVAERLRMDELQVVRLVMELVGAGPPGGFR